ncbi:MAG TPA: DUF721 domain-containing protein [Gemmatimonadaceae bacterium]
MPNDPGPEPLGEALRRFLDGAGLAPRVEQAAVLEEWPRVVGPTVAAVTRPMAVTADGTLFVAVRTAAWMSELALLEREIVSRLREVSPRAPVVRIRWQMAP